MVRVCTCLCCNLPSIIPSKSFFIKKNTHQLCNCNSRMCIIHLDSYLFIELLDIVMFLLIFCNCCLQAGRYEEILLFQSQLFSGIVIVVRIKNLYDILCKILLFHCLVIITAVERIQLEVYDRLRIPDTKCIYHMIIVAYDWIIIRNCHNRLIILLFEMNIACLVVIFYTDISTETHFFGILRSSKLKRITIFEPVIRGLYLIAIFDLLLEHTVTVTDTAAISCVSECCKGIQEAGCQTAKTAITKCRIRFLVLDGI